MLVPCGDTVNEYQILRNLPSGATGRAFEARELGSSESVFLKQFYTSPTSQKAPRFKLLQRELIERLAQIRYSAVFLKDFFVYKGAFIQVAEWIYGPLLSDIEQRVDRQQRQCYAIHLSASVRAIHEHGIAHLNLKPQKVIIQNPPNAILSTLRLIGFSAAHIEGMENLEVMGTPGYASPEHFPGFRHKLGYPSQASDVFTLGIMLYQLLGPSYPFEIPAGLEFQDQMRALKDCLKDGHVRPLTDLDDSISPIVSDAVLKCLSLWPKDRPTARDVAGILSKEFGTPHV